MRLYLSEPIRGFHQMWLNKIYIKLSLWKQFIINFTQSQKFHLENKNHDSRETRDRNDCFVRDFVLYFIQPTCSTGHSISYMQLDDDRETRRLTIDLLRYRVEREFPSLDPRNSQCGLWRHLSYLYNELLWKKENCDLSRYCF